MTAIPNLNILLYNSCGIVWSPQFLILYKVSPVNGYQEGSGGGSLGALGATIHLKGNISERNAPDQASLFCLTYSVKLDNVRKLVLTECLFSSIPMHLSIHVFMYVYKAFQSCLEKRQSVFPNENYRRSGSHVMKILPMSRCQCVLRLHHKSNNNVIFDVRDASTCARHFLPKNWNAT